MILPATRRALELLVQAGGELVLLGPGWHQAATCGEQYVEGPCWVPHDRGPGRRPRVIEPVRCEDAEELIRLGWATTIGMRPTGVLLLILPDGERAAEPSTLEDLECEQCGGWIGVPGGCDCEEVDHG